MRAMGVDAAGKVGWIGIVIDDAGFQQALVDQELTALIAAADATGRLEMIGVDIPIGLLDRGPRACDEQARRFIGARGSSVFPAPPAIALDPHEGYHQLNLTLVGMGRPKMSKQSYALMVKIRQAAAASATDDRIVEVHPEASFRAMHGRPLPASKKSWNGLTMRRNLLAAATPSIRIPDDLGATGLVASDDVVDAAAAAWSARRAAHDEAIQLGLPAQHDRSGRAIGIWY